MDSIDHVAIPVTDIKAAIDWYTKTFKCEIDYQDDTWAYLKFHNIHLALVVPSEHPQHIALAVSNPEKFGELTKHRDGIKSTYIKDPWGNSVELLKKAKSSG